MFSGLSAFPLTPMNERGLDESAFVRLIGRLVTAEVDSIGVLGSTGNYAYQPLSADEVFGLYKTVTQALSVPLCVYDNPRTTQFVFSDKLHGEIAQLPNVASIKIPGVPENAGEASARVERLRAQIPSHVTVGVSDW